MAAADMIGQLVRTVTGVPIVANFANLDGTPIVVDDATGNAYTLVNGVVTLLMGGWSHPHIKDYGAVCDGLTDDTATIAACLLANPNRTIYVNGTPLISSTISVAGRQRLMFEGGPDAGITAPPASYFKKKSTMTTVGVLLGFGAIMDGGGVDCSTGATGGGVQLAGNTATCRNVTVFGFPAVPSGDGFRVGDTAGTNTNGWLLDNCNASSMSGHGFLVHDGAGGAPNANAGTALKCQAISNAGDGFKNQNAGVNLFVGCVAETNTGAGIRMATPANANYIVGGDYEGNTAGQIILDSGSASTCILGQSLTSITDNSDATTTNSTVRLDRLVSKQGAWTPVLIGSSVAGTQTYSTQVGTYIRFGDMVYVTCHLTLTAKDATTAGNMQITGLPFALPAGFTSSISGAAIAQWGGITFPANYTQLGCTLSAGDQFFKLVRSGSSVGAAFVGAAETSATTSVIFSGWYPIAQF